MLFPVIGGLKDGQYSYEGRTYKLPSHGFARASEFSVTRAGEDCAELTLVSSAKTREGYPFDFSLRCSFQLERAGIAVRYDVTNTGAGACTSPSALTRRSSSRLPAGRWRTTTCCSNGTKHGAMVFQGRHGDRREDGRSPREQPGAQPFADDCFDQGILIFKHPVSREFSIVNSRNARAVKVITEGVPYVGVWSKPGGAPFVCIEPWHGIPDMSDTSGNLVDKEGILSLEPRGIFSTGYRVEIT